MRANVSNRTAIALGGAALVLVLLGLWFVVVSPKRSEAAKLQSDVAAAEAELAQKKADLANPSAALTVRTSDVFRLAARHGLTLEGFQPTVQIPVTG